MSDFILYIAILVIIYIVVVMLQVGKRLYTEVQSGSENFARFPPPTARGGLGFPSAPVLYAVLNGMMNGYGSKQ